jgi:hypothetical protein
LCSLCSSEIFNWYITVSFLAYFPFLRTECGRINSPCYHCLCVCPHFSFWTSWLIFWNIMPCSPLEVNRHFGGIYCLQLHSQRISQARSQCERRWEIGFMLVSCSPYSAILKMEAMCSSEMSVDFQQTTWHYIPEDSTLHNDCCENFRFHDPH